MITREQLGEMFDNMAKETPWDLRKPLVWGYFFTHGSRPALEAVVPLLQDRERGGLVLLTGALACLSLANGEDTYLTALVIYLACVAAMGFWLKSRNTE